MKAGPGRTGEGETVTPVGWAFWPLAASGIVAAVAVTMTVVAKLVSIVLTRLLMFGSKPKKFLSKYFRSGNSGKLFRAAAAPAALVDTAGEGGMHEASNLSEITPNRRE